MTEHEAILSIKDVMQGYQAESEKFFDTIFGQLTFNEIREALQDYHGLIDEIKQILREVEKNDD